MAGGAIYDLTESVLSGKNAKETLSSVGQNALNWGVSSAIGGAFSAAISSLKSGVLGYAADTVGETVIDTVSDVAQGGKITVGSIAGNLAFNAVTEGVSSNVKGNKVSTSDGELVTYRRVQDDGTGNATSQPRIQIS
ncbi:MAG: hypothetical protein ACK5LM_00075, partial [Lactovum sp.]